VLALTSTGDIGSDAWPLIRSRPLRPNLMSVGSLGAGGQGGTPSQSGSMQSALPSQSSSTMLSQSVSGPGVHNVVAVVEVVVAVVAVVLLVVAVVLVSVVVVAVLVVVVSVVLLVDDVVVSVVLDVVVSVVLVVLDVVVIVVSCGAVVGVVLVVAVVVVAVVVVAVVVVAVVVVAVVVVAVVVVAVVVVAVVVVAVEVVAVVVVAVLVVVVGGGTFRPTMSILSQLHFEPVPGSVSSSLVQKPSGWLSQLVHVPVSTTLSALESVHVIIVVNVKVEKRHVPPMPLVHGPVTLLPHGFVFCAYTSPQLSPSAL
jgi:hypothetical protein